MLFSVSIPGFGSVFVDVPDASLVEAAVRRFMDRVQLPSAGDGLDVDPVPVTADEVEGQLTLNSEGVPVFIDREEPGQTAPTLMASRSGDPGGNSAAVFPASATTAPTSGLPLDVQEFPFASFQNAVAALGLDPEGALGGTVNRRFEALAPAAEIGSLTGTIDPIGQSPGALQQFFSERFGDLDLAAQTFRDLLAGRTSGDLDADELLSFRALRNPDISTNQGRGAAGDVFRLARAAAADRFGSFVASQLLPSNARLFRELERELAQGDPSTDFLQFARQQNLLPA